MQQTFLSAYRSILGGRPPRDPAAWLATIARNECRGRAQARMREPLAFSDDEEHGAAPDALTEAISSFDLKRLCRAPPPPRTSRAWPKRPSSPTGRA